MDTSSAKNGGIAAFDSGGDALADCLHLLVRQNGREISREALVAGLPLVDNKLTPELFVRAAERLGFSARVVRKRLEAISPLMLPMVLLLKDHQACIYKAKPSEDEIELLIPESGGGVLRVPRATIAEQYTGLAIVIQPLPELEDRLRWAFFGQPNEGNWFWRVLFSYRRLYVDVAVASVLINIFVLASPLFIMNVYDKVIPNQAEYTLWVMAIGVLTVFLFDFVLRMTRGYLINVAGKRADIVLASQIFSHILNLRLADRPGSAGSFASHIREFESVRDFFSSATMAVLLDLPFLFLFLGVIWMLSGILVLVPLAAVPCVLLVGWLIQKPLNRLTKNQLNESSRRHSYLVESISNLETIKALGLQGWAQQRWEKAVSDTGRTALQTRFVSSIGMYFTVWAQQATTVVAVLFGFYLIVNGDMTTGGLVATTILSGRALAPLAQVANLLTRLEQSRASLANLDAIMRQPPERDFAREYLNKPVFEGDIHFKDVTFMYPGQKVPALNEVGFHIAAGEKVGILGKVGSGKSTIQKLILGLYHPSQGSILLDGVDLDQVDPFDLRNNIAYVPQNPVLFQGTLRQNLFAVAPRLETPHLMRALKISGLHGLVANHPQGLDMQVGEGGDHLSGGQRQLVVLARALLRDCPMMLLDEPTNSLDNTAERNFVNSLKPFLAGKTLLLVTHKISLLDLVDRLIIFEDGRLMADGPKAEILSALTRTKSKQVASS